MSERFCSNCKYGDQAISDAPCSDCFETRRHVSWESEFDLTQNQANILRLLADGYANKRIATELKIGLQTVKNNLTILMRMAEAENRTQLAFWAIREGIVCA